MASAGRRRGQQFVGRVVSTYNQKTARIAVPRRVKHKLLPIYLNKETRLNCHDEHELTRVGDLVRVEYVRPLSKTKHHAVVEILERARNEDGKVEIPEEDLRAAGDGAEGRK